MRLREALLAAIRYDTFLAKKSRSDLLKISEDLQFISSEFRGKFQDKAFVGLSAKECLDEDWFLMKDGKEFKADSYYYVNY